MAQTSTSQERVVGGDFVIKRALKAGGFGTVYEAHQLSTGQRRALKILHAKLAAEDSNAITRFHTEATAASRVQSAYVVQVIAAGVDATSGPWIAMEYLRGCDLLDWVRTNGPMSWTQARQVLQHLCHALGAAHRAGIVHRDLKPENIFLAESSGLETPFITKILDFGIAKAFEGTSTTTAGIGSWAWLAPEQASVQSRVSPKTDVWALGLVAFFLLTGKSYWLAFQEGAEGSILRELGQDQFEVASTRALRLRCPVIFPPGFDQWFAACVTQAPQRFQDASFAGASLPAAPIPSLAAAAITLPNQRVFPVRNTGQKPSWPVGWVLFGGASVVVGIGAIALMATKDKDPGSLAYTAPAGPQTSVTSTALTPGVAPTTATSSTNYTPPLVDAPGCSVDCSAGCEHVLITAGPAFGYLENLARRQREQEGLCAEISRIVPRPARAPSDQFSYSLWVTKGWRVPPEWRDSDGVFRIPSSTVLVHEDSMRVPEMRGQRLFPPRCRAEALSLTAGASQLAGNSVQGQCGLTPPSEAIERGEIWTWKASNGGVCSCRTNDQDLQPLRDLGQCLISCGASDTCVDQCEKSSPGAAP